MCSGVEVAGENVNLLWVCSSMSEKTLTTLRSTGLVAYPVYFWLLNSSAAYRW